MNYFKIKVIANSIMFILYIIIFARFSDLEIQLYITDFWVAYLTSLKITCKPGKNNKIKIHIYRNYILLTYHEILLFN